MGRKGTEQLAWEIRLIARPGTMFATHEDQAPGYVLDELGLDLNTDWPDLWLEVPDQPDFQGRSKTAYAWLDAEAPVSGHYRLRRFVDDRLVSVQMVKTITSRPVQAEIDIDMAPVEPDPEPVTVPQDGTVVELHPSPSLPEGSVPMENPQVGDTFEQDGSVYQCVEANEETGKITWQFSHTLDEEPEAHEAKESSSAGEAEAPTKQPDQATQDTSQASSRALWEAAPLRKCRSLRDCCLCGISITKGQHYYDRGYGKRAHKACVVAESSFPVTQQ